MDDSFELEYADELDALDELDHDEPAIATAPKSKRSLVFENARHESDLAADTAEDSFADTAEDLFDSGQQSKTIGHKHAPSTSLGEFLRQSSTDEPGDNFKRKRMLETWDIEDEIDGDFDIPESIDSSPKRVKLTEEEVVEGRMLKQILDQRALKSNTTANNQNVELYRRNDGDDTERPRVSKRIPQCDFISARSYDGSSVYMKLWNDDVLEAEYDSMGCDSRPTSLLSVPVGILRDQIEQANCDKEACGMNDTDIEIVDKRKSREVEMSEDTEEDVDDLTNSLKSLWVEKYAPRKYTELLSEEAVNRSLLHWMKLWDYTVFDKEVPKSKKKDKNKEMEYKRFNKFNKKPELDIEESLDKFKRPLQKVALLCGPPGLGKTTLAHIVARHAGYNVVEMNASDDRSVEVFRTKLESATQMKAVLGSDPSPNCLVIDEIDGAPAPAINILLNMIKRSEMNEASNKKKKEGGILRRPIICICNDQFVPALRQLRQMALLLNFPQTEASRLASRLYEVVQVEELKADINTLLALCERTDNDIRSCLNTLQFVRQKQKELSLQTVRTMSVGQKDSQKSLFAVWQAVFAMPREKKNRFISIQDLAEGNQSSLKTNNMSLPARFQHILHMVQSAGEYDRVMQGLFENYLSAKSKDPHLIGLNLSNDWLCFVDGLNRYLAVSQDYSVAKYMSYLPIMFHFLYASYNPQRLQFPQSQSEAHQKEMKTKNVLASMMADMTPLVRKFIDPDQMILDMLSPLIDVLQPTLRPVNTLLYSNREKEELANVVRIMIAYNMTYRQEKSLEGQYNYVLDPNVEEIVQFPDLKQRKQLTYAAKQMISREIDLEKMRRTDGMKSEHNPAPAPPTNTHSKRVTDTSNKKNAYNNNSSSSSSNVNNNNSSSSSSEKEKKDTSQEIQAADVPNHLKKLEAKKITDTGRPGINFFSKFVRTKREKSTLETDSTPKEDKNKGKLLDTIIWFHFKEGYSNAVRRTVKVEDLL